MKLNLKNIVITITSTK